MVDDWDGHDPPCSSLDFPQDFMIQKKKGIL